MKFGALLLDRFSAKF